MKLIRIFLIICVFSLNVFSTFAKISLGTFPEQDSVMMFIRDIEEIDPVPYEQAYQQEMKNLKATLDKYEKYEETAKYYISDPMSEIQKSSSTYGNLKSLISAVKSKNSVTTSEQKEFVEMLLELLKSNNGNPKEIKDIEKKLAKGKLSDKIKPYIQSYYRESGSLKQIIKDTMSQLELLKRNKGVIETMQQAYPDNQIETRMMKVKDTVLNSSFRPALYVNRETVKLFPDDEMNPEKTMDKDKCDIRKNWEWVLNNEFPEKSESFPVSVIYSYSEKYPDYRFVNIASISQPEWIICDNKGNLIAIPEFTNEALSMYDNELKESLLAYAYKYNMRDIQNYDAHTQHYVKVQSGLESLTTKEKQASERASTNLANAFINSMKANMKYGQGSKKAKAVGRESAKKIVGTLLSGSDFYDDLGYRWVEEITGMYESKLTRPYRTERVNNTTFRSVYADDNGDGLFEIITEYLTDSPYRYKLKHTVKSLSGTHIFSPEDVILYNTLRTKYNVRNKK